MFNFALVAMQSKYAHYFPRSENQSETFGHIVVLNKKMSHSQHGITRRVFEVKDIKVPIHSRFCVAWSYFHNCFRNPS